MKYDFDLDLSTKNSASIILNRISKNSVILEFGPANGRMTKYLQRELNCKVYTVELDEEAAKETSKYSEKIIVGNIEDYFWLNEYRGIRFDYIIFADVLEHLYYPEEVLHKSGDLLADNGSILVSLPNIAHNSIIIELLKDNFYYNNEGILDNTHIRFFTKKTLEELILKSGFNICYQSAVYIAPSNTEFYNDYESLSDSLSLELKKRPYGEVYQFIIEAKKAKCKKVIEFDSKQKQILYIDTGMGFNEKEKIIQYVDFSKTLSFIFNISKYKNIFSIMFVPLELALDVDIESIIINGNEINSYSHSGIKNRDKSISFLYGVPKIIVDVSDIKCVDNIEFNFKKIRLIESLKDEQIQEKNEQIQEKNKQIQGKNKQIQEKNKQIQEKNKQIQERDKQAEEYKIEFIKKQKEIETLYSSNKQLEQIAQSMRIKNRIKKLMPPILILLLKNIRKTLSFIKNGRFREVIVKVRKRILPYKSIARHTPITKLNNVLIKSPMIHNIRDTIDIVIPVYNGMEYLEPLFDSLFNNTDIKYRLIIINDASPDYKVKQYILDKIDNKDNCFYFENSTNLGFTQTINFAVTKVKSKFFVILNTDVVVPKRWLSRLVTPFYTTDKIASITPFSNSAVFFSYPIFGEDNKLPSGFTFQEVDNAFQSLNPKIDKDCDIHSGVGFCMAINKLCWDEIGSFDAKAFGKGYGEENDWCMRAIHHGWRNVLCPNLFVFHNHGGSFDSSEKQFLMQTNSKLLQRRWPDAMASIENFIKQDPWLKYRVAASLMLSQSTKKCLLIIDLDNEKGGAYLYREDKINYFSDKNYKVLLLTHSIDRKEWVLSTRYGEIEHKYSLKNIFELKVLFTQIDIKNIFINNLVFIKESELINVFKTIKEIKKSYNIKIEYVFHDFLSLCPSFFLMGSDNNFCNLPISIKCNECIHNNLNKTVEVTNIDKWRKIWKNFFLDVDKLTCFSNNSRILIKKIYSNLDIDVQEHKALVSFTDEYIKPDSNSPLIIGCFGAFSESKGSNEIIALAKILKQKHKEAKILVFGNIYTQIDNMPDNIHFMGLYKRDELPQILIQNSISVVFFASIIPETFSYVVQELMLAKVPIVCFDIGAPAERIRVSKYEPSCIASKISAESILVCIEKLYERLI